jgi:WD40 repeat protein
MNLERQAVLKAHQGYIKSVLFWDENKLVTAGQDKVVRFFDTRLKEG